MGTMQMTAGGWYALCDPQSGTWCAEHAPRIAANYATKLLLALFVATPVARNTVAILL